MTARCARMRDGTVKQAVKRWRERVSIRGERIALPVDGPLEQAAWMKERIARAKLALANGCCGLPLVQSCPAAERVAEPRELPRRRLVPGRAPTAPSEARRLLERERKQGNVWLIEERDERSLSRIVEGFDQIEADRPDGGELELRELAAPDQTEGA